MHLLQIPTKATMVGGTAVFAQSGGGSGGDITGYLLNYGILGLVALAFWTDQIISKHAAKRLIEDRLRAEKQRDAIIEMQHEKVIPLLEGINVRLVPLMERVTKQLDHSEGQR